MDKRLLAISLALASTSSFAQTTSSLGAGGYSQDFDTLPSAAPVAVGNPANLGASVNPALNGLFAVQTGPDINPSIVPSDALIPNPGDVLPGGLLSFARPIGAADRALGFFASPDNGNVSLGLRLRNNSGTGLTSVNLAFVLEQYLEAGNQTLTPRSLQFSYRLIDPSLSDASFAATLGNEAGWQTAGFATTIRDGSGGFLSFATGAAGAAVFAPRATNGTPVGLDGNAAQNRRLVSSEITLGGVLDVGSDIAIRFTDLDDAGSDPGVGIDTVGVRPGAPVPEPATLATISLGIAALSARRRKRSSR